jgi:hypothetical protein
MPGGQVRILTEFFGTVGPYTPLSFSQIGVLYEPRALQNFVPGVQLQRSGW